MTRGAGPGADQVPDTVAADSKPHVDATSHSQSPFVRQWLSHHRQKYTNYPDGLTGTYGGAELVREALLLPPAQRGEVMAELQRMYGNNYIAQAMAGGVPTLKDQKKDAPEVETILPIAYWEKYGPKMLPQAIERAAGAAKISLAAPGVTLQAPEALVRAALAPLSVNADFFAVSEILGVDLSDLIDSARILDEHGFGADQWEPAIVDKLTERMLHETYRAVVHLALPYAKARAKAMRAATSQTGGMLTPQPSIMLAPEYVEPKPMELGATRPLEASVASALCSGIVDFDLDSFDQRLEAHLPGGEPLEAPQEIELELERGRGDWMMVRVVTPVSVTARDVANELYGTPELAHLIAGAGDRFAFGFPPGKQLAEPYDSDWSGYLAGEEEAVGSEVVLRNSHDPFLVIDDQAADEAALAASQGRSDGGKEQGNTLQRLTIMESLVGEIFNQSASLGVSDMMGPVLQRLQDRRTACMANPAEAEKWAAQTNDQLSILSKARDGFTALTNELLGSGFAGMSTPDGEELVGDVSAQMAIPAREVARCWAHVVVASEDFGAASERIALAQERLEQYPFDMVDRALALVQSRMDRVQSTGDVFIQTIEPARIQALHDDLAATVARLRVAMLNGDGTAAIELKGLRSKLSLLDLHSTVGATMGAIQTIAEQVRSVVNGATDTDELRNLSAEINIELGTWYPLLEKYDSLWSAGTDATQTNIDALKAELARRSTQSRLPELIQRASVFTEDEAKKKQYIRILNIIVFAIAAATTGGLASMALGGGIVGGVVGAGVEALTFTGLSQTMKDDPTWGSFFAELGLNFATFGGLRAIGGGAKIIAAGEATLTGKALELTAEGLWMTASAKASAKIEAMMAGGAKVSSHDAATIFAENLLMAFAGRVAGRVGGKVFDKFKNVPEAAKAIEARTSAGALADQVLQGKNMQVGPELAKAETSSLHADAEGFQAIEDLAANKAAAEKAGLEITADDLAAIAEQKRATNWQIKDQEIGALSQNAQVHGDHMVTDARTYDEMVQKHREMGSDVVEGLDASGSKQAVVRPMRADGSLGPPQTVHIQAGTGGMGWANGLQGPQVQSVLGNLGAGMSERMSTGTGALNGAELVEAADAVARLKSTPNVKGVDDWLKFEGTQKPAHMRDAVNELKSAERRAAQNPDQVFEIGQDANAPSRPGTQNARNPQGDPMQSFDIAVKEGDTVAKNIEVTTVAESVKKAPNLTKGVQHATDKIAGRIADGSPIPGKLEAEIQIELFQGTEPKGSGTIDYDGTGNYTYKVNNGTITPTKLGRNPNPGNTFDDFANALPTIRDAEKLAVVTVVDASGNVIATFERQGTSWVWTNKPKGTP